MSPGQGHFTSLTRKVWKRVWIGSHLGMTRSSGQRLALCSGQ